MLSCVRERRLPWTIKVILDKHTTNLNNLIRHGTTDIFNHVFFDTTTSCNRRCYYCPNAVYDRGLIKNEKLMDETLFRKIIDDLAKVNWKGEIAPNFYGEPMLDPRLLDFVAYAHDQLPDSRIVLFTNGDFLSIEFYKKLVQKGVGRFVITHHPPDHPTAIEAIKQVLRYREEFGDDHVEMKYSKLTKIIQWRGMGVGEPINDDYCRSTALNKIGVHWDGEVIFCCNDYYVTTKFGNAKNERLIDIWRKPYYQKVRNGIKKGQFILQTCKDCRAGIPPKVPE